MSGKVRKSSPCSSAKTGPMRATLPMSSLMRQGSSLRKSKSNSPTLSPTSAWKSIDATLSGQRSPGSLNYKAKSKTLNARSSEGFGGSNVIRRTASLDTIYLNGQWPRQSFYLYGGLLVDKATQTDEWTGEQRKLYRHSESLSDEAKLEKVMRHRRINKEATSSRERTAAFSLILQPNTHSETCPSTGTNTPSIGVKAAPVNIPTKPATEKTTTKMRSSIEGLNQEIERLVLKNSTAHENGREEDKTSRATPEGHRAPLADLLRSTRSVNTQTPGNRDVATGSSHSSGPPSRGSTPDLDKLGTSPHINKFLAREPPDGCEKISSKFVEDTRRPMIDLSKFEYCPLKPCLTLKPSLGSAFSPLQVSRANIDVNGELSPADSVGDAEDGDELTSTTLPPVPLQSGGGGTPSPTAPFLTNHHDY